MKKSYFDSLTILFTQSGYLKIRGAAIYSISTTVSQGLLFVNALLLARVMGPTTYGIYVGAYAIATISSFVFTWGQDTWMLRAASLGLSVRATSGAVLRTKLLLGCVWAALVIGIIPLIKPGVFPVLLPAICVLDVWLDSVLTTLLGALNIKNRLTAASILIFISRFIRLLGMIAVALFGQPDPLHFAMVRLALTAASVVIGLSIFLPDFRARNAEWGIHLLRKTTPYGLSDFLALIYIQADVTLITLLAGQQTTGIYSAASGIISALFVLPAAGYTLAIPWLTRIKQTSPNRLLANMTRLLWIFGVTGAGLWLVVILMSKVMVSFLLGQSYRQTADFLLVLSPIVMLKSLEFGLAAGIIAIGWQRERLGPQFIAALVNVVINLWAIPRFGGAGAAGVYLFSELLLACGYAYLLYRWRMTSLAGAST